MLKMALSKDFVIILLSTAIRTGFCFVLNHQSNEDSTPFGLASYYSSHMVLQMAPQRSGIWGYAATTDIGRNVSVSLIGDQGHTEYTATVRQGPIASRAVWSVTFDPMDQGGPYLISAVLDGYPPNVINDVLFGDVWLCSGQSNMQFAINQMFGASYEMGHDEAYTGLRLLNVNRVTSSVPLFDLQSILMSWERPGVASNAAWTSFSAVCFMFGKYLYEDLKRPIGLIGDTWGGTPVECWSSPEALQQCGLDGTSPSDEEVQYLQLDEYAQNFIPGEVPSQNSVLWNAMIHPLLNMTIKGVIWYQGEANTGYHTDKYSCSFPAMIRDWRTQFHRATGGEVPLDMPFGFVQIGPRSDTEKFFGFPEVRWHQMGDDISKLTLSNMFMAVAMDLSDPISPYASVHIRDKMTVAQRLSHAAMCTIYRDESPLLTYPHPTYVQVIPISKHLLVQFGNDKIEINVRSKDGFEVCCADVYSKCPTNSTENWVPAPIMRFNSTTVLLSWSQCTSTMIAAYRYAWRETPCNFRRCAVYSDYSGDPLPTYTQPLEHSMEQAIMRFLLDRLQQEAPTNLI